MRITDSLAAGQWWHLKSTTLRMRATDCLPPESSSSIQSRGAHPTWQHFKAPDGNVYEIIGREIGA